MKKWFAKRFLRKEFLRAYDVGYEDACADMADHLEVTAKIFRGDTKGALEFAKTVKDDMRHRRLKGSTRKEG